MRRRQRDEGPFVLVAMFTGPDAFVFVRLRPRRILEELAALHRMAPEAVLEVLEHAPDGAEDVLWSFNPGMRRVRVYYGDSPE